MDKTVLPSTTVVSVRFLSDAIVVISIDDDVIEDLDEDEEEELVVEEDVLAYRDFVRCIDLLEEENDEDENENDELVDDDVLIM